MARKESEIQFGKTLIHLGKKIPNIDIQYGQETWETTMQKSCINHKRGMSSKEGEALSI